MSNVIRMMSSQSERLFRTAQPIAAADLTERHLDMLQLDIETSLEIRLQLGDASDAIQSGNLGATVVQRVVAAYNARAGR